MGESLLVKVNPCNLPVVTKSYWIEQSEVGIDYCMVVREYLSFLEHLVVGVIALIGRENLRSHNWQ